LTSLIFDILKNQFKLTGAELWDTFEKPTKEDQYRQDRDPDKQEHVIKVFPNGEAGGHIGGNRLKRKIESVCYITHPYNHSLGINPATTVSHMRSFGRMLKKHGAGVKHLVLVTPVGPFDLNHSFERKLREGLVEYDTLRMYLEDLDHAGYNEIITIGSHSPTTRDISTRELGMNFREVDPFRPKWEVPIRKMGPLLYTCPKNTDPREDYEKQMTILTPFVTYIIEKYGNKLEDICFVATDEGSEKMIDPLTHACRGDVQNILPIIKERQDAGKSKIVGLRSGGTIELDALEGKVCIIVDDRRLSGNTINEIAEELKGKYKAGEVVSLTTHDISYDNNIRDHTSIDRFVFLETNPNSAIAGLDDPRIYRMPMATTALLLASEIFDSYVTLRDMGEVTVR